MMMTRRESFPLLFTNIVYDMSATIVAVEAIAIVLCLVALCRLLSVAPLVGASRGLSLATPLDVESEARENRIATPPFASSSPPPYQNAEA